MNFLALGHQIFNLVRFCILWTHNWRVELLHSKLTERRGKSKERYTMYSCNTALINISMISIKKVNSVPHCHHVVSRCSSTWTSLPYPSFETLKKYCLSYLKNPLISGETTFTMCQFVVTINNGTTGVFYPDLNHCRHWFTIFGCEIHIMVFVFKLNCAFLHL